MSVDDLAERIRNLPMSKRLDLAANLIEADLERTRPTILGILWSVLEELDGEPHRAPRGG